MTFIALCGDTAPHFTTIAHFISTLGEEIAHVFAAVLAVCDREGLIGREMFAIAGVKLPSNASKQRSGTRADFERQAMKLETAATAMIERHRAADTLPTEPDLTAKEAKRLAQLNRDASQLREWLTMHPKERRGPKSTVRQSNRTDNESAKMATGKGVIQGYTGVAAVDSAHQIIVEAQAHGTGAEQELLVPVVDAKQGMLADNSLITADAGYHSEANLAQLDEILTQSSHWMAPVPSRRCHQQACASRCSGAERRAAIAAPRPILRLSVAFTPQGAADRDRFSSFMCGRSWPECRDFNKERG